MSQNSSAKMPATHQISPPYSSTTFASPPFSSRPASGMSIPKDRRSEGLLMAENRRGTQKKRTEPSRRVSFIMQHPANDC
jgi:hypothetical protein